MGRSLQWGLAMMMVLAGCREERAALVPRAPASAVPRDFSTPEGAILCLEDAYRRKDIEAAVRCKDFPIESRLMLLNTGIPMDQVDDELVAETAEVLELAYRKQFEQMGFPDMASVASKFAARMRCQDGVVMVTELLEYPDGVSFTQRILVAETAAGWRVLNVVE